MADNNLKTAGELLAGNSYPGRGIAIGISADCNKIFAAYFIMGRSANSRNRVFVRDGCDLMIRPADEAKVEDPSLIIYYPVRKMNNILIVTNGDQTDTIAKHLIEGGTFDEALASREFEPDAPNYTPRISSIVIMDTAGNARYELSILKSADKNGKSCSRYFFNYEPVAGRGHLIHTYITDDTPLPSFVGEPENIVLSDNLEDFVSDIWNNLDDDNRISIYGRSVDLAGGEDKDILINKYEVMEG